MVDRRKDRAVPRKGVLPVIDQFYADLSRDGISVFSARFSDKLREREYQKHMIEDELPKERLQNYLGIAVFCSFGILDVLTVQTHATELLSLRLLVCAPLLLALTGLTYIERFKPAYDLITGVNVFLCAIAIIAMIALMPAQGAPPYIIGVFVVFIYSSCVTRIRLPIAGSVYAVSSVIYSAVLLLEDDYAYNDVVAGHFFMFSIASVSIVTSFVQEVRVRQMWLRNRQRDIDAANIERLLIEATAADRAKISFLSILSHELRTPLHQIVGFSEVLKSEPGCGGSPQSSEYLNYIHSSASRLLSSIGRMLRYADATAGKISYEIEPCSVRYLVETVIDQARVKAEAAGIRLATGTLDASSLAIDHLHTAYALGQLIDNAIAASARGAFVRLSGEVESESRYRLVISDEGVGMTPEQINAALTPFMQTEDFKTRSMEGVGLGVSLAKRIVEDQDATLEFISTPGVGTRVVIVLPRAAGDAAEPDADVDPKVLAG